MGERYELGTLGDRALLAGLACLVRKGNELTAELLAYLGEVDERRLHLEHGFPSLFAYCTERLGLSEAAAGRRIAAARVCRAYPQVFAAVARGDLHLSALCALRPYLDQKNAAELLSACHRKTRRQVEQIIAHHFPRRDVPASIRRLPVTEPKSGKVHSLSGAASGAEFGGGSSDASPSLQHAAPVSPRPRIEPLSTARYGVHFTADIRLKSKIEKARALASHRLPSGDLAGLVELAFDALIRDLERQRFALGREPRAARALSPGDSATRSRHIPADVARKVYVRDGEQCTFIAAGGRRCEARAFLEFDHAEPWASGGASTAENLRLRCRAHNQWQARAQFGSLLASAQREPRLGTPPK
ncbi:MAG TPA: DUF222 domain-containing protein [Polyangiaceae bacterium]|jgi:hypothetical protein